MVQWLVSGSLMDHGTCHWYKMGEWDEHRSYIVAFGAA
jgi:hypothetical protein